MEVVLTSWYSGKALVVIFHELGQPKVGCMHVEIVSSFRSLVSLSCSVLLALSTLPLA